MSSQEVPSSEDHHGQDHIKIQIFSLRRTQREVLEMLYHSLFLFGANAWLICRVVMDIFHGVMKFQSSTSSCSLPKRRTLASNILIIALCLSVLTVSGANSQCPRDECSTAPDCHKYWSGIEKCTTQKPYHCGKNQDGEVKIFCHERHICKPGLANQVITLKDGENILKCTECEAGRFQPINTSRIGCEYEHLPPQDQDVVLYKAGTSTSQPIYYCDYKNGYFHSQQQLFCNHDRPQCHCESVAENPLYKCKNDEDLLPNRTCVKKCKEGVDRSPDLNFSCSVVPTRSTTANPTVTITTSRNEVTEIHLSSETTPPAKLPPDHDGNKNTVYIGVFCTIVGMAIIAVLLVWYGRKKGWFCNEQKVREETRSESQPMMTAGTTDQRNGVTPPGGTELQEVRTVNGNATTEANAQQEGLQTADPLPARPYRPPDQPTGVTPPGGTELQEVRTVNENATTEANAQQEGLQTADPLPPRPSQPPDQPTAANTGAPAQNASHPPAAPPPPGTSQPPEQHPGQVQKVVHNYYAPTKVYQVTNADKANLGDATYVFEKEGAERPDISSHEEDQDEEEDERSDGNDEDLVGHPAPSHLAPTAAQEDD